MFRNPHRKTNNQAQIAVVGDRRYSGWVQLGVHCTIQVLGTSFATLYAVCSCPRMLQLTPSSIVMQSVCIIQCIFQYAFRDTCKQGFVNAAVQRTTYQAGERLFGEFQCPQCHRKWASGNSWVNTRQECLNCRIMVSPHYQRRLDMPAQETYTRDLDKPHLTEMCEKCQQLGRDCSRRW